MAFTVLGNVPVWYYRTDALKDAAIKPPTTVQDVLASCAKLSKPPSTYGAVLRGERGNGIRYEWMQWMVGRGGTVVKDPENGDYTATVNSAQNKAALDDFLEVAKKCGAPNPGSLGQGDVIQLLATGKALQGQLVLAAWANFQDPKKSAVVGQARRRADSARRGWQERRGDRQLELRDSQGHQCGASEGRAGVREMVHQLRRADRVREGGWIPNRSDVLASELARDPAYRWMPAYTETLKTARQELGYLEGPQVEQVLGLRLNQAMIGGLILRQGTGPRGAGDQRHLRQAAPDRLGQPLPSAKPQDRNGVSAHRGCRARHARAAVRERRI